MTLRQILAHFRLPHRSDTCAESENTYWRGAMLILLVTFNIVGLTLFLYFASFIWAPRGDEGLLGGPGEAIIWTLGALPWPVLCALLNLLVFRTACARLILYGRWGTAACLLAITVLWITAFEYDLSRHYNGSLIRSDETDHPTR